MRFKNHSPRAKWWDYSKPETYFITICTKDKTPYFGKIENKTIILSEIGGIVVDEWQKSPEIRADMHLKLGEFVVMPDHFHAIIEVGMNAFNLQTNSISDENGNFISYNSFQPQSKNLAAIIRGFKSSVTIRARQINPSFKWHKLYHDVIIQSENSFQRIERYILNNPKNWKS